MMFDHRPRSRKMATAVVRRSLAVRARLVGVEFVGITGEIGVVSDRLRLVLLPARSRTWDDRLQLANLAVLEGVGGLPEIVRKSAGEWQLVQRVDPIRP